MGSNLSTYAVSRGRGGTPNRKEHPRSKTRGVIRERGISEGDRVGSKETGGKGERRDEDEGEWRVEGGEQAATQGKG